jgi:RNA polymerase sigma factor (sigma-70 family)
MGSTTRARRRRTTGDTVALVARLHAGDRDAFDQLYRQYRPALTRWVSAQLPARDHATVDDCVHDAFCAALADPTRIGADVRGSLRRLAARACRAHRSTPGQVRIPDLLYVDAVAAADDDPAGGSPQPAQRRRVWIGHALDRLGDEHRRVIELRYLHGHPQPVVAALIGRPVSAVQTLQRQALRHLRAQLTAAGVTSIGAGTPIPV